MDEQEMINLLADIKKHVAYSKTALAELIAERRNEISRFAKDKNDFERLVAELQRRIGDLPRLITEAEQEYDKKHREAIKLEVQADDMDKKRGTHENRSLKSGLTAGMLGLGALLALPTGMYHF